MKHVWIATESYSYGDTFILGVFASEKSAVEFVSSYADERGKKDIVPRNENGIWLWPVGFYAVERHEVKS